MAQPDWAALERQTGDLVGQVGLSSTRCRCRKPSGHCLDGP
jgi:hypothetical protein